MNKMLYPVNKGGHPDHGWLKTYYSWSFANYYNANRISFGKLLVLNEDTVSAEKGFGMHPHDNMEKVTVPLSGALEHNDSMGNSGVVKSGEIQIMSADKDIYHSDFNHSKDEAVELLQIWAIPYRKDVEPRYDQISWNKSRTINNFYTLISPGKSGDGSRIYQDARFSLVTVEKNSSVKYAVNINRDGNMYLSSTGILKQPGKI